MLAGSQLVKDRMYSQVESSLCLPASKWPHTRAQVRCIRLETGTFLIHPIQQQILSDLPTEFTLTISSASNMAQVTVTSPVLQLYLSQLQPHHLQTARVMVLNV